MTERPDFIIVGGHHQGKVYLIASREVREATVETTHDYELAYWGSRRTTPIDERTDISAEVRGYDMVIANTYGEAWSTLFGQWSPPGRPEISNAKALEQ